MITALKLILNKFQLLKYCLVYLENVLWAISATDRELSACIIEKKMAYVLLDPSHKSTKKTECNKMAPC